MNSEHLHHLPFSNIHEHFEKRPHALNEVAYKITAKELLAKINEKLQRKRSLSSSKSIFKLLNEANLSITIEWMENDSVKGSPLIEVFKDGSIAVKRLVEGKPQVLSGDEKIIAYVLHLPFTPLSTAAGPSAKKHSPY